MAARSTREQSWWSTLSAIGHAGEMATDEPVVEFIADGLARPPEHLIQTVGVVLWEQRFTPRDLRLKGSLLVARSDPPSRPSVGRISAADRQPAS